MLKAIQNENIAEILEILPDYKDIKENILSRFGMDLTAISKALKVATSYKSNVIVIPKTAQEDIRLMQTEAIQSYEELGAILYWTSFKYYTNNELCLIISILDTIVPCRNIAFNPKRSFSPDDNSLINAINEVVSGEYQGFSILHTHPTDSFLSCMDMKTKTYADVNDSLDLYHIWENYLTFTDITKTDIDDIYKVYTFLPDIVVMGGVSHECILFNFYGYSISTLLLLYYDIEHCYLGKWLSLYEYLEKYRYTSPYGDLYNHFCSKCYTPFRFTGFSVIEQKRMDDKVYYVITRL